MLRKLWIAAFLLVVSIAACAQQYKVSGKISLPGEGVGWDYLFADSENRTLYVSHGSDVNLVDLDSEKPTTTIGGMKRIHGVAVANDLGRGFISDGGDNSVVIFDLKSHAVLQKVAVGTNPDGVLYDPSSKKVFSFNGKSKDVTVLDAATGKVLATTPVGGKPEFPVSDGKGNVYANIEDTHEIIQIDSATMKVRSRWPMAECEEPTGLAMDLPGRRLFSVCANKKMEVVDADSGKVVATVAIGDGPDAVVYDADRKLILSSNGDDGTLTVVHQDGLDKYTVLQNLATEKRARTLALDQKTHKVYLASAEMTPAPAPTATDPKPRPKIAQGTFHLIVVSPGS
ncbi:MAG: YncE family protein [Acidobacteriota bacterium]|nr:YncE family protein [Acidobacteriota bacterium]